MKKNQNRIASILLSATILLSTMFGAIMFSSKPIADKPDELSLEELKTKILLREEVPLGIDYDEAVKEGHKARLYDQEPNDHTVIFQNEDNTRTMYYYNVPVKYTEDGETNDIKLSVEETDLFSEYDYENATNSVKLNFPENIEKGILIEGETDIKVEPEMPATRSLSAIKAPRGSLFLSLTSEIVPETEVIAENQGEYIDYEGAFGEHTTLRYTPIVNGVKQDVILDQNIGENEFTFVFDFGEKTLQEFEDGGLYVYDAASETHTGYITPIYVFDAEGKIAENCYYTYEKTEEGKWRVTAVVDEAFLNNEETVYPVTIDPDYIDTPAYGVKDAMVNNGAKNKNYGSATSIYIGQYTSGSIMRMLIGFSQLDLSNIDPSQIYSAKFSLKDIAPSTASLTLHAYEYLNSWDESTVTWNSSGMGDASNYSSSYIDTQTVSKSIGENNTYTHRYYLNIKNTAKKWCQYKHYQSYGFMLKSSSETTARYCTFGSQDASSNRPTLIFRYYPAEQTLANGTYYLKNMYSSKYLTRASDDIHTYNACQKTLAGTARQRWTLEYYADGYYYIHEGNNPDRSIYADGNNVRTAGTVEGGVNQLFRIIKSKYGYRIMSKNYPAQCIELASANTTEGSNVERGAYDKKQYQEWELVPAADIPQSVTITPVSKTLKIGETVQLSGAVTPSTAPQGLIWNSSNPSVATVSSGGLVTAFATGTTTITAQSKNYSYAVATCSITVLNKPDLSVGICAVTNQFVAQNSSIYATITNGNSPSSTCSLNITINDSNEQVVFSKNLTIPALGTNETVNLQTVWVPETADTYSIVITADADNVVDEADESNNSTTINHETEYDDISEPTNNTIEGAETVTLNLHSDSDYGTMYNSSLLHNRIYKPGDVDYYKINTENMIMVEILVPQNLTVSVLNEEGEELGTLSEAGKYLKVKTDVETCYIKATSQTVGLYTLNVKVYSEK